MRTLILFSICLLLTIQCGAQIYSEDASREVVTTVNTETPKIKNDTVQAGNQAFIKHTLTYPKVILVLVSMPTLDGWPEIVWDWAVRAYTKDGQRVMLKPDDEYLILQKLISPPVPKK